MKSLSILEAHYKQQSGCDSAIFYWKTHTIRFLKHDEDTCNSWSRMIFSFLIYRKNGLSCKIKQSIDRRVIFADNLSHYFNLYGENPDVGHLLVIVCLLRLTFQFVTRTILTVPTLLRQNQFFYIGKFDSKKLLTKP